MPISITGTGTITGISAGGLPDDCITTAEIAGSAVTPAKLSGAQTGSAPIYGARAWVNFDGTRNEADTGASTDGANVKIRASGNVTSVLKNGAGDYTVSFTTAMSDANYALSGICQEGSGGGAPDRILLDETTVHTSSLARILVINHSSNTLVDSAVVMVMVIR
jgi:hypothetical protein